MPHLARWTVLGVSATLALGCGTADTKATDSAAAMAPAAPAAPAPAPAIALATVAGKWNVKVMSETSDSTLLTYVLTATADTTGWTITFPGRKAIPVHAMTSGDSIVIDAGPYPSALRKNMQVTTHGAMHMKDGKLAGKNVAHYKTTGADSVRVLRSEATRAP